MHSHSVYKVPQGKLLKISLKYNENTNSITEIKIFGDFFAYPEEAIEQMETQLKHAVLDKEELLSKIRQIITAYNIEFIGVDAEGLTQAIMMCKA